VAVRLDDIEPPDDFEPLDDFEDDRGGVGEAVRVPGVTSCADRWRETIQRSKLKKRKKTSEERWSMVKWGLGTRDGRRACLHQRAKQYHLAHPGAMQVRVLLYSYLGAYSHSKKITIVVRASVTW
jgi:hypothetical protein